MKKSPDTQLFHAIYSQRFGTADILSRFLSGATEYAIVWILLAGGLYVWGDTHGQTTAVGMIIALGVAVFITHAIFRTIFRRPRPYAALPHVRQIGWTWVNNSFPSGHVATTVAMISVFASMFPGFRPLVFVVAPAIMWSRVYNGMHWPSDVLVGLMVGLLSSWVVLTYFI